MTDGNTVNDIIAPEVEDDTPNVAQPNTLQDAIKEMGKILHERYLERNSNLSHENIDGMVQVDALNKYMSVNFGYRFKVLDELVRSKGSRVVSKDGFGIVAFNDLVKSIQATFEQHQIPENLKGLVRR
jgi:hypothetical protein